MAPRRSVVDSHLITVDLAFQSGALLLDLSEHGMGVQALSSAPIGSTTPLHFELPEPGGRVNGVGRIAWTDSSGRLGIRFEDVAEASRLHLSQWLARDHRPLASAAAKAAMPAWPPPHMRDEIAALRRDLSIEKLDGDPALVFVVERMRSVIRATGAAIALQDGGSILCRASSGNAPPIGAQVDPDAGLSGECLRTGEIVRCEDTETDPRADRLVCRRLELRSIVIVPVRLEGRPVGVLEAFSSHAHAFQSSDVLLLRRVSDLVAEIAHARPQATAGLAPGPPPLMAAAMLEPFAGEPAPEAPIPAVLEEIMALEAADTPVAAAAALEMPVVPPASVETAESAAPAAVAETAVPAPSLVALDVPATMLAARVARSEAANAPAADLNRVRAALSGRESFRTAAPALSRSEWAMRIVTGAILVAVLVAAGWQLWRSVTPPMPAPSRPISREPARPVPVPAPEPETVAAVVPSRVAEKPKATPPARPAVKPPAEIPVDVTRAVNPQAKPVNVPAQAVAEPAPPAPAPQVETQQVPAPPAIALAARPAGEASPISKVLTAPVAEPKLEPPRVSHLTGGKLLKKFSPVYPSNTVGVYGQVVLKAIVDRAGRVTKVQIVRGHVALAQAAVAAVKRWRYEPFQLNGEPIEVENTIVVDFKPAGER